MKDELTQEQTETILNALETALSEGPWDQSNFLRIIGKKLQKIHDDFASHVHHKPSEALTTTPTHSQKTALESEDTLKVFISLYAAEGNKIPVWERVIANLPRQLISRPIYSEEIDVQTLIKSKEKQRNEAYVVAFVPRKSILTGDPQKMPKDKFGKSLYMLRERALTLDNIERFVHASGTYHYIKGHLVKVA
ncbi:MAG: Dot/Icm secretion system protein IcmQ [Legionella sp.]|nr:Dot/Icm secretion system protein IcmQ [Legionella sp.]